MVVVPEGAIVPGGTVVVVVTGGAVVEDSVVVVVGGTPEEQAPKPADATITRVKAPFFRSFIGGYLLPVFAQSINVGEVGWIRIRNPHALKTFSS